MLMNANEFLAVLGHELGDLAADDRQQILEYYQELILDGEEQGYSEEEMIEGFGNPQDVAKRVRAEYGGMVVYAGSARDEEAKDYRASDLVHTIQVEATNVTIRVRTVETGPIRVLFKPRENRDRIAFSEENGVFCFRHEMRSLFHLNWLNLLWDFSILILEIPKNFAGTMVLKTSNAGIRAANLQNLMRGEFVAMNGKIALKNVHAEETFLKTANAFLDMENVSGRRLEAITNNGNVSAKECDFPEGILLQTKNGFVTGRNLISDCISMQSCNGSITGTVIGNINDYTIDSQTVNGSNNLDCASGQMGSKKLTARTTNGRIKIEFIR